MADSRIRFSLKQIIRDLLSAIQLEDFFDTQAVLNVLEYTYNLPDSDEKNDRCGEADNLALRYVLKNPDADALFSFYAERNEWRMVLLLADSVEKEQLTSESRKKLGEIMAFALEVKTDGSLLAASVLLERGACPNQKHNSSSPLYFALDLEDTEEKENWIIRLLQAGANPNTSDFVHFIGRFTSKNRWNVVLQIIEDSKVKPDPDNLALIISHAIGCKDRASKTVMLAALKKGANVHYSLEFESKSAAPAPAEKWIESLLHQAVRSKDSEAIKLLLSFRANPHSPNSEQVSALNLAMEREKCFKRYDQQVRLISAYHTARVACLILNYKQRKPGEATSPFESLPQEMVRVIVQLAFGGLFAQFNYDNVDEIASLEKLSQARLAQPPVASSDFVADKNFRNKFAPHKDAIYYLSWRMGLTLHKSPACQELLPQSSQLEVVLR